jgi:hypothetical protein
MPSNRRGTQIYADRETANRHEFARLVRPQTDAEQNQGRGIKSADYTGYADFVKETGVQTRHTQIRKARSKGGRLAPVFPSNDEVYSAHLTDSLPGQRQSHTDLFQGLWSATVFIHPILPSEIRSKNESPMCLYPLAMLTTNRRLALIINARAL